MRRPVLLLGGLLLAIVAAGVASKSLPPGLPLAVDNAELRQLYEEDEADRARADSLAIEPTSASPDDGERQRRVKAIIERNRLATAADYYHAAVVLQHGGTPSDVMLAHELSMVALALGDERARRLAVATLDRYLLESGLAQRWGTQYRRTPGEPAETRYAVEPGVTDTMREVMDVPSLDPERK